MSQRTIKLFVQYAIVFAAAIVTNFAVPRLAPGNAIDYLIPPEQSGKLSPAEHRRLLHMYGLDAGTWTQFRRYIVGLVHGDLGVSIRYGRPVRELLLARLPWTFALIGLSILIGGVLGTALGFRSAWNRGSGRDARTMAAILCIDALPPFFVGMLLILVFSIGLHWFPVLTQFQPRTSNPWATLRGAPRRMALPLATLVIASTGPVYLAARSALVGELSEDYVVMAEAKGLSERHVRRHARRNAYGPVVTVVLLALGAVVAGATVIETVFSYPGLGRLTYDSVLARDYPALQAVFLLLALTVMTANLLSDLLYPLLDPRVRQPVGRPI